MQTKLEARKRTDQKKKSKSQIISNNFNVINFISLLSCFFGSTCDEEFLEFYFQASPFGSLKSDKKSLANIISMVYFNVLICVGGWSEFNDQEIL